MAEPLALSRAEARRVAVRGQLLTAARPTDLLAVVRRLTIVQAEPTRAVAPSADLVLWGRLGAAYDPAHLRSAIEEQRLIEHQGFVRPIEDMALLRAQMAAWPGADEGRLSGRVAWLEANDACRRDVLALLRADGPLPTSALPDTCVVPWRSSGWNSDRNVAMLLMLLTARGEVAAVGREGREQLWDLAERVYPDDPVPDVDEALRRLDARRLHALGIARARSAVTPNEPHHVGAAGVPAVVEGVRGTWRVDPELLEQSFAGRVALLSPFDRLIADRKRMGEIFGFDYQLEMYKPAVQRRWGYYALPILYADRLIGKLDATADRAEGALVVRAVHEDEPFAPDVREAVDAEIADLAAWLGLDVVHDPVV